MDSDRSRDSLAGRRILITGGTGFIGRRLARSVLDRGGNVVALGFRSQGFEPGCTPAVCDLEDEFAVRSMVENHRPELVFHLAAAVSAREDLDLVLPMLRANLNGSVHLLKALYGTVCQRVVQAGTYEEGRDGEVPGSPYGVAKACARLYANFFAQHHGLQVVHARLDLTYGPHQPEHRLIAYLIRTVLAGQTPALKTPQRRYGYLYLDDAVAALIECATTPGLGGCTVDVTGDERISVADVALLLEETIRSTGAPAVWPAPREAGTPADPRWTWRPQVSLVEGLKRTLDYYQREKERSLAACR